MPRTNYGRNSALFNHYNDTRLTRFQEDVTELFPKDESKPEFISDFSENVETYFQKQNGLCFNNKLGCPSKTS